jgi:hypothetical protein
VWPPLEIAANSALEPNSPGIQIPQETTTHLLDVKNMDPEDWEILSDDGFVEIHDDGGKQIFSRKYEADPKIVFNMNYFICKSPISREFSDPQEMGKTQFLPPPVELEKAEVFTDFPIEAEKVKSPGGVFWETDYIVSQVSFQKENEFVDMKMDSPRACGWGIVPQIDAELFQFDDHKSEVEFESGKNREELDSKGKEVKWERENGGVNILKWSLNGIGAICSFGVAAATVCVIILGNGNHHHQRNKQQNQKIQFQIYADEKRIKQVVQHANKLSEAISAAHFTYGGGYHDHGH